MWLWQVRRQLRLDRNTGQDQRTGTSNPLLQMLMDKGLSTQIFTQVPTNRIRHLPLAQRWPLSNLDALEESPFILTPLTQPNVFKITFLCPAHLKISPSIQNWFKKAYPPKSPSGWRIRMTVGGNQPEGRVFMTYTLSHRCPFVLFRVPLP